MHRSQHSLLAAVVVALWSSGLEAAPVPIIETVVGDFYPSGWPATTVPMAPSSIAVDSSGNLYVADAQNYFIFRIDSTGRTHVVAGTGFSGNCYNGAPASTTPVRPYDVVVDAADNLYFVADNRVYKVDSTGILRAVAGSGTPGYSGDGGLATSAALAPAAITVDTAGNLYITQSYGQRLRKVDTAGIIDTIAGNGEYGYSGDGGPAVAARLNGPTDVAVDAAGNLYIADYQNYRVRKVDTAGIITTYAGNGSRNYSGDGGPATSAGLGRPIAIAVDAAGNLYILRDVRPRIRKVDTAGIITTVAGNGTNDFRGDGGVATRASLSSASNVALDSAGNLYVADWGNGRVRMVESGIINTVAGNGSHRYGGDGGPAINGRLNLPQGVSLDSAGNLYVVDQGNHRVRKVDAAGIITTVAGNGIRGDGGDGGLAPDANLNFPSSVAVDFAGNLYIADSSNYRVRKVDTAGIITTVAGNGIQGYGGDGGPATQASLGHPMGVAVDAAGDFYVADSSNYRVRKVDAAGIITTIAGNGSPSYGGDGGFAIHASLSYPVNVAVDVDGSLYIVDSAKVRKVDAGGIITTVAGNGIHGYGGDGGPATHASLELPSDVAVDAAGNLYIVDVGNQRVRKVDATGIITTFAGSGIYGFGGDGGPADHSRLALPQGVVVDRDTYVYIADSDNHRIRRVTFPRPPSCAVASPVDVECAGISTAVELDGSASGDPDGDPITYSWTTDCPGGRFDDATVAAPTLFVASAAPGGTRVRCRARLTVTDDGGLSDTCAPVAVRVADTLPPELTVDAAPIVAVDADCSGRETVELPAASGADVCDPAPVVTYGPTAFTAGETATVTYTATDASSNTASATVAVTVRYGAGVAVRAIRHVVVGGNHPRSRTAPLADLAVCGYGASQGSCARSVCGGVSPQHYPCIALGDGGRGPCTPTSCCTTDAGGECTLDLPPGDHLVIAADALPEPLGVSAGNLRCGELQRKILRQVLEIDVPRAD